MKISPVNNMFFQKKIAATAGILAGNYPAPCNIYQLEEEDVDYFSELLDTAGWTKGEHIYSLDYDLHNGLDGDIYVLEDNKNNCLGCMEIYNPDENRLVLEFIETKPTYRSRNKNRTKRYIGETLVNFLVQLAKKENKSIVHVIYPEHRAYGFYEKCGFTPEDDIGLKYEVKNSDELLEQNYNHTGYKINLEV